MATSSPAKECRSLGEINPNTLVAETVLGEEDKKPAATAPTINGRDRPADSLGGILHLEGGGDNSGGNGGGDDQQPKDVLVHRLNS